MREGVLVKIRPITESDAAAVLALNAESVRALTPLDPVGMAAALREAAHVLGCEVDGSLAAFAVAYEPGSSYGSTNYSWFGRRYDDFLYLDRIAVGVGFRRRGIATLLYDELEARATPRGRMVCEVYSEPPNVGSLAFHARRGYREVGQLAQPDGHVTVMLEKPL
jgi:uncharacterized protein